MKVRKVLEEWEVKRMFILKGVRRERSVGLCITLGVFISTIVSSIGLVILVDVVGIFVINIIAVVVKIVHI